jgi:hypothetical protein
MRLAFKPNVTINDALPNYQYAIRLSQSLIPMFNATDSKATTSWFKNPVGTALNKVASVDFSSYIARGFDLNVKIALFNGTLNKAVIESELSEIKNPYYDSQFGAYFSENQDRICMGGPLGDSRNFRCITIKLVESTESN